MLGTLRFWAEARQARWRVHRACVEGAWPAPPFVGRRRRCLFLSAPEPIATTQVFPFFCYARALGRAWNVQFREVPLARFRKQPPYRGAVDAVCFQSWFDAAGGAIGEFARAVQEAYPAARLAYLDWFAPADLRYAEELDPYLHAYVKKHLYRDRARYGAPTLGDTNLTDYYCRRLNIAEPMAMHQVPAGFWDKLVVGPPFALSPHMLPYFARRFPRGERPIDVHARIAVQGTPWYSGMRGEAQAAVAPLAGLRVAAKGRVSRRAYFRELFAAKLCFSPFGYGEVCWRDYEAALSGALLLKPDMSHLETYPDIFEPFRSYVPLRWDLGDLEEKVRYYLAHEAEREAIARRAFAIVQDYLLSGGFLEQARPLFERLFG